jgi:hypothetical protein
MTQPGLKVQRKVGILSRHAVGLKRIKFHSLGVGSAGLPPLFEFFLNLKEERGLAHLPNLEILPFSS